MNRNACLIALLALGLAACGKQTTQPEQAPPDTTVVPATTPPVETQRSDTVAAAPDTVPARFLGRWGLVKADCDPARDDTKGLMTVTPGKLTFWESRATVRKATPTPGGGVALDLAFEGEGQTWAVSSNFVLADDGRTLVREDRKPALFERYLRCPA